MINIRLVRGRIKSAKNIAQITKAMELVSAAKMKKAQLLAASGRLYAQKIYEMVISLSSKVDISEHKLLSRPKQLSGKKLVIIISTNKGLCGGLNANLFRFALKNIGDTTGNSYVTLGKKGAAFVSHGKGKILADFSQSTPFIREVPALSELAIREFLTGRVDSVELVYNECFSVVRQQPKVKTILPLSVSQAGESAVVLSHNVLIEPNATEVFAALLPHYLENQLRDAVLQADASEHSARMMAMRSATDNAKAFIRDLTLLYNKARQEKITSEIADIVTARLAVQEGDL